MNMYPDRCHYALGHGDGFGKGPHGRSHGDGHGFGFGYVGKGEGLFCNQGGSSWDTKRLPFLQVGDDPFTLLIHVLP